MVTSRPQNRRLLDRYDLREHLGRGGMGLVWLADDTVLQRQVAIKEVEFPPGVPADEAESLRARVMREARAAGRLNHPNVTTIYDVVQDEGRTWIVMEYVDAPTLTELVDRQGALSVADTVAVGLQVLSALEAAHAAGIVHRDVKPSNVMVDADGRAKLADFGVAAVQGDPKITMTGLIIGSPSYMAPEQAREGRSTEATDLWGLGATLYYAVEGQAPFDRGAPIPTLTAVTHEAPRPMERGGALAPVVSRLLDKEPDARPTAGELRAALEDLGRAADTPAAAPATTEVLPTPAAPPATQRLEPEPRQHLDDDAPAGAVEGPRRGRSPVPLVLGVLALLALAGWLLSGALGGGDGGETAAPRAEQAQDEPQDRQRDDQPADAEAPAQAPAAEEEAPPAEDEAPAAEDPVPTEWESFSIGDTGSTVGYPGDWTAVQRSATATDLTDPAGGRYLRVDYTDTPKDDPVADWQAQSESFGSSHADYQEIRIEPVDFRGHEAALWEYTYSEGGAQLHAYNLAVIAGDRGYALNFQSREDQWTESQELWEQFQSSFQPAP